MKDNWSLTANFKDDIRSLLKRLEKIDITKGLHNVSLYVTQLKLAFTQGFQKLAFNTLDHVRLVFELKHNIFSEKFNKKLKHQNIGLEEEEHKKYEQQ